jgi:hypothetical protein
MPVLLKNIAKNLHNSNNLIVCVCVCVCVCGATHHAREYNCFQSIAQLFPRRITNNFKDSRNPFLEARCGFFSFHPCPSPKGEGQG